MRVIEDWNKIPAEVKRLRNSEIFRRNYKQLRADVRGSTWTTGYDFTSKPLSFVNRKTLYIGNATQKLYPYKPLRNSCPEITF
jgi:hypothetical protein